MPCFLYNRENNHRWGHKNLWSTQENTCCCGEFIFVSDSNRVKWTWRMRSDIWTYARVVWCYVDVDLLCGLYDRISGCSESERFAVAIFFWNPTMKLLKFGSNWGFSVSKVSCFFGVGFPSCLCQFDFILVILFKSWYFFNFMRMFLIFLTFFRGQFEWFSILMMIIYSC